jgi:hypothetical protein
MCDLASKETTSFRAEHFWKRPSPCARIMPMRSNNLRVVLVRQRRYARPKEKSETCIRVAPGFDQAYLHLAGLYVTLDEKEKA